MKINKNYRLDPEEEKLLREIEAGEWQPLPNQEEEIRKAREAARVTLARLAKNANINIRLNRQDVQKIKQKAAEAGLPYQTLIGSILHQFARGKLDVRL